MNIERPSSTSEPLTRNAPIDDPAHERDVSTRFVTVSNTLDGTVVGGDDDRARDDAWLTPRVGRPS